MNVSSAALLQAPSLALDPQQQTQDPKQTATSCREFEATLWRQILEKALAPMLASNASGESAGNGVYSFFLSNTIAERVSGQPHGFASMLQAQMAAQAPTAPPTSNPICTKAATH